MLLLMWEEIRAMERVKVRRPFKDQLANKDRLQDMVGLKIIGLWRWEQDSLPPENDSSHSSRD